MIAFAPSLRYRAVAPSLLDRVGSSTSQRIIAITWGRLGLDYCEASPLSHPAMLTAVDHHRAWDFQSRRPLGRIVVRPWGGLR